MTPIRRRMALALLGALLGAGLLAALLPAAAARAAAIQETLALPNGTRLPSRLWRPQGPVKAVILALHGFNDYSHAFAAPAAFWAKRGILTLAYDQPGFGANADRGQWAGSDTLIRDLEAAVAVLRARYPGLPLFVLGESMGGAVAMTAQAAREATGRGPLADGLILVAPAVWSRDTMPVWQVDALALAMQYLPQIALPAVPLPFRPTDDNAVLNGLARDPLVIKQTRVEAINGLVDLMDRAMAAASGLRGRMLILLGAQDEIVPPAASRRMLERLPRNAEAVTARRVIVYPQGYHMLLRDLDARRAWGDVAAWVLGDAPGDAPAP